MDNPGIANFIFFAIFGVIPAIVIISVIFGHIVDRKGIKNSKKMDAGSPGSDSVYLS